MNRAFYFLTVLLVILLTAACTVNTNSSGKSNRDSKQWPDLTDLLGQEIVIAEDNAWPPFAFIDKQTGSPIGFDYDLFTEICKRANCIPVFKEFAWDGLFEAGIAGEWDVTCWGITMTLERSKRIDFSDPIMEYGQIVMVRKDSQRFIDAEELKNSDAILGATIGSAEHLTSESIVGQERLKLFDTDDMPVLALLSRDVDALVYDETAAIGVLMEHGDALEVSGRINSGLFIALAMPPGSPIQVAMNSALNEMWEDGTMGELQKKWFPNLP